MLAESDNDGYVCSSFAVLEMEIRHIRKRCKAAGDDLVREYVNLPTLSPCISSKNAGALWSTPFVFLMQLHTKKFSSYSIFLKLSRLMAIRGL